MVGAPVVDAKTAARLSGLHVKTVLAWAREGRIVARRIGAGRGPWRVLVGDDGLPVDGQCASARRSTASTSRSTRR